VVHSIIRVFVHVTGAMKFARKVCTLYSYMYIIWLAWVFLMVFNATFNNISVISWLSVLLLEENGVPGEKLRPCASRTQTLLHKVVSSEWDSNSQG
jgi:hypothetical protein